MTRGLVLLASCLIMACATTQTAPPEPDPVGVIEAWHGALVDGKPDEAYSLLGPELQRQVSLDAFRILYQRQKADLVSQAKRILDQVRKLAPEQRAVVKVGAATAELVRGPDGWRLTRPVGPPPPQK